MRSCFLNPSQISGSPLCFLYNEMFGQEYPSEANNLCLLLCPLESPCSHVSALDAHRGSRVKMGAYTTCVPFTSTQTSKWLILNGFGRMKAVTTGVHLPMMVVCLPRELNIPIYLASDSCMCPPGY